MRKIITAFMLLLCAVCMASAANYLTFTAEEDSSTFGIVNIYNNPDVQYSLDGGNTWNALTEGDTVMLVHVGDKALLKGNNPNRFSSQEDAFTRFVMTGKIAASGSVMSLVDGAGLSSEIPVNYCFYALFMGCASLTKAPELPATTLTKSCYDGMFSSCSSLTKAPELPATTLTESCYDGMFSGCSSLAQAPELPATTLARRCYSSMFYGCSSLTQAPELPATTLAPNCYYAMFCFCTSLSQASELPATTLAENCYEHMFHGCTSLTQAPDLRATTLAKCCCLCMFEGCSSLTQAPELPATTLAEQCYSMMFNDCTSLTQAPELPATTLAEECYAGMFFNCVALTRAPALSATTLANGCYSRMFYRCLVLSEINVSFDDWSDDGGTFDWVQSVVARTGTFICPKTVPIEYGTSRIPEGWKVKNIIDGDTVDVPATYNCLTFTAEEDGSTLGIETGGKKLNIQYSLDEGETWIAFTEYDTVTLVHRGDNVFLRGFNNGSKRVHFIMTGTIAASGSVMSLIDGTGYSTEIPGECSFSGLFSGCASLTQAPELPATKLNTSCYSHMFEGCTSLTQAPELPATTLGYSCYESMFSGCTSLTKAPELPATKLNTSCYSHMFSGCTSLTQVPNMPAVEMNQYSCSYMFSGCTSLTQAPNMPITRISFGCCSYMFSGCTSLTQAPELPATTLEYSCYESMFSGCTSLTQAPELPATTLPIYCYKNMFAGCTSLTQAPELPATTLKNQCYYEMFAGCTNLSQIHVSLESWGNDLETYGWVKDVAPTGTFICPKTLPLEYGTNRIPDGWTVKYAEDIVVVPNYLTFTAEEDGSSFGIVSNGDNNPDVQYSLDGGETWTALAEGDSVVLAHKGDKALLKGYNPQGFSKNYDHYSAFKMTGKVSASGSVMSLIDSTGLSTKIPKSYCFLYLFENCASLTQAPELPATTLVESCYVEMFSGCASLTQAPELPATTLADGCYYGMFSDCTSLTQAPELPVTSLSFYCYAGMFSGCTSLAQAPELPATTLAEGCYASMFWNCTSLTQAPELPATTLAESCYATMFSGCTGLTQAPELPATTLAESCYEKMFKDCSNLTQAPELPVKTLAKGCYRCMFENCTSLTQAPELPATTLAEGCYAVMFLGCTNLSEISVAFNEWDDNTAEWVYNVAPTGTFICPKTLALEYGISWIPEGWTVKYIEDMANYLTFTAEEDSSTFGFVNKYKNNPNVQYSLDGGETWTSLAEGKTVMLAHKGDKALLRGDNPKGFSKDWYQYSYFKMTGKVAASGSVMSLIDGTGLSTEIPDSSSLFGLFKDCKSLTQAPELSATTLTKSCYDAMFSGCTSLTQAPALPATTLADYCYMDMFSGCTSLTQAPELPATTLTGYCYYEMFSGCTSLTQAPELPATTLATHCYYLMFSECAGLTQAPELPATTLVEYCYYTMFSDCTGLTQAPELPATTLAKFCYCGMFDGCTSLSLIKVPFVDWFDNEEATSGWIRDVAPTGTFICPKDLPLEYRLNRIPLNWEVQYIEGGGSGVSSALSDGITVWTDDLTIFVCGAEGEVSLYDMSGRRIAVSNSADEERALCVPSKGVYVVRTSGGERSVLVR